ncbi:class I SAM-dependent methyltransferase [Cognataquiflexum rubidum]|uniref:class I SAM-dependent methyltransferase n=1 Tax=Cognataquiflexum rubidum TaxID=2922273 RepID=UPI001F13765F|nr:methyltransferase domain-containing protein [Cognataquiflexum rubidum]MCH6235151.1 class I SAM-dependent methyltransferase [Cognataquiflexum rubidum]
MKKFLLPVILLFFVSTLFGQTQTKTDAIYTYKTPDRDGTGKVYMGREISQVMNFMGMSWLERSTRPQEENTELAIKNLPIDKKSVVADIGAGSGYYTFRIAKKVPEGKVYAIEIQDPAIKYLEDRSKELGFDNVVTIKGTEKSPMLPENSINLAIMVDVYHELEYPHEVLQNIKKSLKPDGKLLLIEYRGEDPKVAIKRLHKMTVEQVTKELSANGFTLVQNGQFMKIQHFLVFEKE